MTDASPRAASPPVSCPKFQPKPDQPKRCRHYLSNGGCGLPDEFMCVEWLRVNKHRPPDEARTTPAPLDRDLFGNPIPRAAMMLEPKAAPPSVAAPLTSTMVQPVDAKLARTVSDAEIVSFKQEKLEVRLGGLDIGDLWIVPAYTGAERNELSIEHAALLAAVGSVFPGARVTSIVRRGERTR